MSVVSLFTHNYTVLHKALIFLMRLAWKSRIRLPYLIMIGFMNLGLEAYGRNHVNTAGFDTSEEFCEALTQKAALDIRLTLDIVIHVEHQPPDNGFQHSSSSSDSEDSDDFQEVPN